MKIFYRVLNSNMAGGQRVLLDILGEATRRGHQAIVSSPEPGRLTEILNKSNVGLHFLSLRKTFFVHQAVTLAAYLRKNKVDLAHSHDMVAGNVLTRLAAAVAGVPCISHIHIDNPFHAHPWIRKYQIFLDNLTSGLCQKVIAVSEKTKESLLRQGVPPEKIEVVRNGIDAPSPPPLKNRGQILKQLGLPPEAMLIGCVARLCKTKGQEELLRAAQHFLKRKNVFFVFVGEDLEQKGTYTKELTQLARSLEITSQVRFAGYQEDVNSFMHAFHCLVLPSWNEGLPLVVLEAMACGKPVIATRVAGTPELVKNEETGYLINPGNAEELAEALERILSNGARADFLGRQGLEHVRNNFLKRQMLERIMEIYEEAAQKRPVLAKIG